MPLSPNKVVNKQLAQVGRSMACTADFALKGLLSYCLGLSFLPHVPFLDEVFSQYCVQDSPPFF